MGSGAGEGTAGRKTLRWSVLVRIQEQQEGQWVGLEGETGEGQVMKSERHSASNDALPL